MDPPRTLNKETAMVPVVTSSPTPAPAAHITTATPALTSADKPRITQGNDPSSTAGQSSNEDPSRNNDPPIGDPANTESPNNEPSDNHSPGQEPSNYDPSASNPPSDNPSSTTPDYGSPGRQTSPNNDPSNDESSENNPPIDNLPSNSNNGDPSSNRPPESGSNDLYDDAQDKNDPNRNSGNPYNNNPIGNNKPFSQGSPVDSSNPVSTLGSDQPNIQSQGGPNHNPAAGDKYIANSQQNQGFGSLIDNAFGYTPSSTLLPVNNAGMPSPSPEILQTVVNDIPLPVLVGGASVSVATNGAVLVAGHTIDPGHLITISGAVISVDSNSVVINGIHYTQPLNLGTAPITALGVPATLPGAEEASMTQASRLDPMAIETQVFTPNPSGFIVDGTTISPGGPGITISGTAISLQPLGRGLVVGSSTLALAASAATPELPTPITIGNEVITPQATGFSIAGTTILPGGSGVIVDGTLVSLEPLNSNGEGLVVGSRTIGLGTTSTDSVDTVPSKSMGSVTSALSGGGATTSAQETGSASPDGSECLRSQMRGSRFLVVVGFLTTFSLLAFV